MTAQVPAPVPDDVADVARPGDVRPAAVALVGAAMASTVPGADRPELVLADGPSGLAMNLPDFSGKVPATSFPAPVALASTWDVDLVQEVAAAIGTEARAAGAHVLLGPSVNIKRSPLGGRNFEYYAEDPHLAGRVGAAFVRGVQSAGVGACVKHFAVNSQETDRMRVSAELSERALREIYLPAFEQVVTTSAPAMVMASYNRVGGVHAAQHPGLLTGVLRDEWGFDGVVVSDWGAVDDPVAAVAAGCDLQMPGPAPAAVDAIVTAVADGDLPRSAVDTAVARLDAVARRWGAGSAPADDDGDRAARHVALARRAAAASFVLLRNEGETLPLTGQGELLVVGALARAPRREGGGSAEVVGTSADTPWDALEAAWPGPSAFAPGYGPADGADGADGAGGPKTDEDAGTNSDTSTDTAARAARLRDEAVARARGASAVVLVVGTPSGEDSEGSDRTTIDLPADQVALIEALAATGTPMTVVVNAGGVVAMPWRESVGAVLAAWLPGCAGGAALADVLLGVVGPSGRLAETVPLAIEDTPAWPGFPASDGRALHGEGVLVGYRWYDRADRAVAYPFGHGLTYTRFGYGAPTVTAADDAHVVLAFDLTNRGDRAGAEVWQVYVSDPQDVADREVRRLAAFGRVELAPGASRTVEVVLDRRAFARWDDRTHGWAVSAGEHVVAVGASSRDLRGEVGVHREGDHARPTLTEGSTLREWLTDDLAGPLLLAEAGRRDPSGASVGFLSDPTVRQMIGDMPVHRLFDGPAPALGPALLDAVRDGIAAEPRPGG
ncbi:beta-glucosidase [Sediminihabitans luteus]|uniref:Beta-glucosidase n=1 Tax=Sediminihabitans luteus TaxID=1138585 RepID=A0A2M9CCT7_9CELL|nr:glycoside hydrolase family 3 C-terminal domain-containing protein [Sediminihabitans luteus]PJJ69202.1 beta-glucosidase [Sediminihabitans luteus]GII98877.1 glycosyl hydrolase [Sediminihabitans luteus]